ncbi:2,3-butanediol dehydrogenase [Alicyclobacillus shizuokensis]|uniref:2,3-butanediol dehydrogenase n=1 Tax=Alicyclobacillus shizuokensis TaxID=392014 RepID=UPI0008337D7E|nr:2,3-butanediol dehydrogenase [Alicyclobacillus shizuokensis]MCL6626315.1 2,3-butanediol dehydrogenase [Alicyclobacillus shizuokensis]
MKAAMWFGLRDVRVMDTDEPAVDTGMVKIKIEWCGLCGSDLHEFVTGPITIPVHAPHPLTGEVAPVILGHEFSGTVVEVGDGVNELQVGDRVTVEPILSCGRCPQCKMGRYNLCCQRGFIGITGGGGGFAEYITVRSDLVYKLPVNVSFEEGAIVEPTAVALHAVQSSDLRLGCSCAVFGVGPIGLLIIQVARAAGVHPIIAIDLSEERLTKAGELGATQVVNPVSHSAVEVIRDATSGQGVDVSFEAAGSEASFRGALECLKPHGEMVIVSLWEKHVAFDPNSLVLDERRIVSSVAYCRNYPEVLALMESGRINAQALITKKIALEDIVEEGFNTLLADKSHAKILVSPTTR